MRQRNSFPSELKRARKYMVARRPTCAALGCQRRVNPHPIVGWYRQCPKCLARSEQLMRRWRRRGNRQQKCTHCAKRLPANRTRFCRPACANAYNSALNARNRTRVLDALGRSCACTRVRCALGHGARPCGPKRNRALIVLGRPRAFLPAVRRQTPRGQVDWEAGGTRWARYVKLLALPDHGMQVRCWDCFYDAQARQHRALWRQKRAAA